eukprot:gene4464-6313_t
MNIDDSTRFNGNIKHNDNNLEFGNAISNREKEDSNISLDDLRSVLFSRSSNVSNESATNSVNGGTQWSMKKSFATLGDDTMLQPSEQAAMLIFFARDGRKLDSSQLSIRARKCYQLRKKFHNLFRLVAWCLIIFHIFERPTWTYSADKNYNDGGIYPSYELPFMPEPATLTLTSIGVSILWFAVFLEFGYKKNNSNILSIIFAICLGTMKGKSGGLVLDRNGLIVVYSSGNLSTISMTCGSLENNLCIKSLGILITIISFSAAGAKFFSASPIEGLFVLLIETHFERSIAYIVRSVPKIFFLLLVLSYFVCTYTVLGFLIFPPNTAESQGYFSFYGSSVWDMLMVLNGSNWPTPMMPAYHTNRLYVTYFIFYLICLDWGLLNLVSGIIYAIFKVEQERISHLEAQIRHSNLVEAMNILDVEKKGFLNYAQVDNLLKEVFEFHEKFYIIKMPTNRLNSINYGINITGKPTPEERYDLLLNLDERKQGIIEENEFLQIEERCFGDALESLRAKKVKFNRKLSTASNNSSILNGVPNLRPFTMMRKESVIENNFNQKSDKIFYGGSFVQNARDSDAMSERESTDVKFERALSTASAYSGIDNANIIERFNAVSYAKGGKVSKFQLLIDNISLIIDSKDYDMVCDAILSVIGGIFIWGDSDNDLFILMVVLASIMSILKITVKGLFRFTNSYRNMIDSFLVVLMIIVLIERDINDYNSDYVDDFGIRGLVILRLALFPRNIWVLTSFNQLRKRNRLAFEYAFKGATHITFLLVLMLFMLYSFAGLGQQIFGGLIAKSGSLGERIEESMYGQNNYWPLNFNDMPSGIATMFILLSVNNMHITTSGFVAATNQWAEVFFAIFYAVGVVFLLNIITAAFLKEFTEYLEKLAESNKLIDTLSGSPSLIGMGPVSFYRASMSKLNLEQFNRAPFPYFNFHSTRMTSTESSNSKINGSNGPSVNLKKEFSHHSTKTDAIHNRFSTSIFASQTKRQYLNDWVNSFYLKFKKSDSGNQLNNHNNNVNKQLIRRISKEGDPSVIKILGEQLIEPEVINPININVDAKYDSSNLSYIKKSAEIAIPGSHASHHIKYRNNNINNIVENCADQKYKDEKCDSISSVQNQSKKTGFSFNDQWHISPNDFDDNLNVPANPSVSTINIINDDNTRIRQVNIAANQSNNSLNNSGKTHNSNSSLNNLSSGPSSVAHSMRASMDSTRHSALFKKNELMDLKEDSNMELDDDIIADLDLNLSFQTATNHSNHHSTSLPKLSFRLSEVESKDMMEDDYQDEDDEDEQDTGTIVVVNAAAEQCPINNTDIISPSPKMSGERHLQMKNHNQKNEPPMELLSNIVNNNDNLKDYLESKDCDYIKKVGILRHEENIQRQMKKLHLSSLLEASSRRQSSMLDWMYGTTKITAHEKAAVMIQFARDGEEHTMFTSRRSLHCYWLHSKILNFLRICTFINCFIRIFERPLWTFRTPDWSNNQIYPKSGVPLLNPDIMWAIKFPILSCLLVGLMLEFMYKEHDMMNIFKFSSWSRVTRYVLMLLCSSQILMLLSYAGSHNNPELVTITSFGSLIYLLWFNRKSFQKLKIVLRIIPRLSLVLIGFFFLVAFFAAVGPFIFNIQNVTFNNDDTINPEYFGDFSSSFWSIFVAITSSDYPNQIIPAYTKYREVFIFFFLFICLGSFGFLNIIVVVVLVEFRKASQFAFDLRKAKRDIMLIRAYEILDFDNKGYIDRNQIKLLLHELYEHYMDFSRAGIPRGAARNILIDILDVDGDGKISIDDFLYFLDVTRIKLSIDMKKTFVDILFPSIASMPQFSAFKRITSSKLFDSIIDCVVVTIIVANLLYNRKDLYSHNSLSAIFTVLIVFIFIIEAAVKIVSRGFKKYFSVLRHRIDGFITIAMILLLIVGVTWGSFLKPNKTVDSVTILMRVFQTFRLILLPRNIPVFAVSESGIKITRIIRRIFTKIFTLSIIFVCSGYLFASLGVFVFGGLIAKSVDDPSYDRILQSPYGQNQFWSLNFNDFLSAVVTLFVCLHVSDFDVVTSGFSAATSNAARIFFGAWYVVGVLLLLNILKAFFLGEFLSFIVSGYNSPFRQSQQNKIDNEGKLDNNNNNDNKYNINNKNYSNNNNKINNDANTRQSLFEENTNPNTRISMSMKHRLLTSINNAANYQTADLIDDHLDDNNTHQDIANGENRPSTFLNLPFSSTRAASLSHILEQMQSNNNNTDNSRLKDGIAAPRAKREVSGIISMEGMQREDFTNNNIVIYNNNQENISIIALPSVKAAIHNKGITDDEDEELHQSNEVSTRSPFHDDDISSNQPLHISDHYYASTSYVKDLDIDREKLLRSRLRSLALGTSPHL